MASSNKLGDKSRREQRREARLEKNKKKFESWIQHHQSLKLKLKSRMVKIVKKNTHIADEGELNPIDSFNGSNRSFEQPTTTLENYEVMLEASGHNNLNALEDVKRKKGSRRKSKTKFEKYFEMDTQDVSADEDLRLLKKLAKKLRVKDKKLHVVDDDINMLYEGVPFCPDSLEGDEEEASRERSNSLKKREKPMSSEDEKSEMAVGSMHIAADADTSDIQLDSLNNSDSSKLRVSKRKKTKFEQYLEMDKKKNIVSAEEDFALERKLAKKLKVKGGKLRGKDDDLNMLFEGISSVLDSLETETDPDTEEASRTSLKKSTVRKKHKKKSAEQEPDIEVERDSVVGVSKPVTSGGTELAFKHNPTTVAVMGGNAKYVAPQLRSLSSKESEEYSQVRRRVRGLLNRLSESNVEAITGDMSTIFQSIGRSVGAQIISEEILASCSGGPRGNEQYAAVFAALVAGMACLVGIDFGAKFLASLAKCFEDEYLKEDNLSLRNLTLLLSYLYIFGVCSSDLIYDFMIMLSKRLTEVDVSTILTILQCSGMKLRSDDPSTMKSFILSVQNRVTELKAASENIQEKTRSKRMEFMLETICDIKNNKKRSKEDTLQHTRVKKWLQKLTVESILIRGLKWSKLLDPDKKGQWWLFGDMTSATDNIEKVASKIDREIPEVQKMLQLAAAQRMNTDARRAIFCIIMSGEDYVDAFEKLLRLDLPGKQDREIMRVLVECCLQEKVFNKYYCVLASKLCSHDKNHKFTLQYCLWDHFTELESMQLIRSMHLSKFVAEMVASFTLSLAVLKKVDLHDATQLTSKRIMHFRMFFEAIFEHSDKLVDNVFKRIAILPEYETLRDGIKFFIRKYVLSRQESFAGKFKVAKKALTNVEEDIL